MCPQAQSPPDNCFKDVKVIIIQLLLYGARDLTQGSRSSIVRRDVIIIFFSIENRACHRRLSARCHNSLLTTRVVDLGTYVVTTFLLLILFIQWSAERNPCIVIPMMKRMIFFFLLRGDKNLDL